MAITADHTLPGGPVAPRDRLPPRARDYAALLDDYAAIARRRGPSAAEVTAIRTRSLAFRDILAHLASQRSMTFAQVRSSTEEQKQGFDPRWAASLGRVVGLQRVLSDDVDVATALLRASADRLSASIRGPYARVLVELLYASGRYDQVHARLSADPELRTHDHGYLWADLVNPFTDTPYPDAAAWQDALARRFSAFELAAPTVDADAPTPFDGLTLQPTRVEHGPLVSVVMTSYAPGRELETSVRSILRQSWQDLEVIVVDDCSPAGHEEVLDRVASLDQRVRLLRLERNGGTYLARNAGVAAARGTFVTGQDDDDWSHPERIARQVRPLLEDAELPGTRSKSLTVNERLVVQRPGYPATRANASSLMVRRDLFDRLGGYLPARKAADSELQQRIEAAQGRTVVTLEEPLALVRIMAESLSRADFLAGWHHPARRAFRSAYEHWHARAVETATPLTVAGRSPVPVPSRFAIVPPPGPVQLDVVLAGDWRKYGGPQKSMLEEIAALRAAGRSVGVLHLEAARFMSRQNPNLCAPVQELINAGEVTRLIDDEPATARLTVLRYPPILQFPPASPLALRSERLLVLANQAPSERDGSDIRYDVDTCADNAETLFGRRALWVPQGPTVRGAIAREVPAGELADFDLPAVLDPAAWATERRSFRSDRPVVGRHSRDDPMKWPADPAKLRAVYPVDGSAEVRVMGGCSTPITVLQTDQPPPSWVCFSKDALPVRTFLNSLDFFVYYQHPQAYEAFGRAVLEALAAGCVAILPRHFEPVFGDAALYAEESEVADLVRRLRADGKAYRAQSARALQRVRERFSRDSYAAMVATLLDTRPEQLQVTASAGAPPAG